MDVDDVKKFIRNADNRQLNALVTAIKDRRKELDNRARNTFGVGDKVKFHAGRRGMIFGVITGFTRTRVLVRSTYGGTNWRVSATLLQPSDHK